MAAASAPNKMLKLETKQVERDVVTEIVCNRCGQPCAATDVGGCHTNFHFAELTLKGGYGSRYDGERHEAQLCESCYAEIIQGFKVVPNVAYEI